MNILDENIIASQRQRLRSWRIRVRQIGVDIARKGLQDEEIIPFLYHLRRPTFFTRDRGFYRREVCHRQYGIVCLEVAPEEVAIFVRRVAAAPQTEYAGQTLGHRRACFSQRVGIMATPRPGRRDDALGGSRGLAVQYRRTRLSKKSNLTIFAEKWSLKIKELGELGLIA
jgi:hypothetical protein